VSPNYVVEVFNRFQENFMKSVPASEAHKMHFLSNYCTTSKSLDLTLAVNVTNGRMEYLVNMKHRYELNISRTRITQEDMKVSLESCKRCLAEKEDISIPFVSLQLTSFGCDKPLTSRVQKLAGSFHNLTKIIVKEIDREINLIKLGQFPNL
jgi:hypothetical protein